MGSAALTTDPAEGGRDRDDARADDASTPEARALADPAAAPPFDRDAIAADLRPLVGDDADALADALADDLCEVRPRRTPTDGSPDGLDLDRRTGGVCYVDRSADDLRGLAARIPALRDLGLTHLQITPVAEPAAADADPAALLAPGVRVRAGLGSAADLGDLADALHDGGLALAVDLSPADADAPLADRIRGAVREAAALAAVGAAWSGWIPPTSSASTPTPTGPRSSASSPPSAAAPPPRSRWPSPPTPTPEDPPSCSTATPCASPTTRR